MILFLANTYSMELPKKINRTEADVDHNVAKRVAAVRGGNFALEVKIVGGRMKKHQPAALQQVEDGTFLYKIPDMGRRNPFDYVFLGDADAIVCTVQKNLRDVHCIINGHYKFNVRI